MRPLLPVLVASMMMFSLFGVPGTTGSGGGAGGGGAGGGPLPPAVDDPVSVVLSTLPHGVSICAFDANADAVLDAGDTLYLETRSDTCGASVAIGTLRLSAFGALGSYSKVKIGDPDLNLAYGPLTDTPGLMDDGSELAFYDADGNGFLNVWDTVYADSDADDTISLGDLRWTPFGSLQRGTIVQSGDIDLGLGLATSGGGLDPLDSSFAFWDIDGDSAYGHVDVPYLDLSQGGPGAAVAVNDMRLGVIIGGGPGSIIGAEDPDVTPTMHSLNAAGVAVCFASTDSDTEYDPGESLYIDISADSCGSTVSANDIRLTVVGAHAAFSKVQTIDADFGSGLVPSGGAGTTSAGIADGSSELDFFDSNGNGFLDGGDTMYADLNGDNIVGVGDFRWTAYGSLAAATVVAAGDADVASVLAVSAANMGSHPLDSSLAFWDLNGDGAFNQDDVPFIDLSQGGADSVVSINDIRLGAIGGGAPGSFVTASDEDVVATLCAMNAFGPDCTTAAGGVSVCFVSTDGDAAYDPGEPLYVDVSSDVCGATVGVNDIRLTGFGDDPPFSRVRAADADHGLALTSSGGAGTTSAGIADATSELDFYDADGNGAWNSADTLYADINGNNVINAGDFRWTPFGSFPGGSTVVNGDADVNLVLHQAAANTGSHGLDATLMFWDINADGGFNADDRPFLHLGPGGPHSLVSRHDVELAVFATAVPEDSDLDGWFTPEDCNDEDPAIHPGAPEVLNGVDDDCDGLVDETAGPGDVDGDGWFAPDDCDDGDATIHPNNNERDNGIDDDCDGIVDEGLDLDGDGHTPIAGGDCDDSNAAVHPGQNEVDNGVDDDCDDVVDDGYDLDSDGYTPIFGNDCDDSSAAVHPGQNEVDNGVDDDCDGLLDEGYDLDGDGYTPIFGGDCNDGDALIHPNNNELDNGVDDDCDGSVDEGLDLDGDSFTPIFGSDCNDGDPLIHPGANERDNVLDDDCDGLIDDGVDSDHDGLDYPAEQVARTDPFDADTDDDGLVDGQELHAWGTDPLDPDTDDDRFDDGNEVQCGSDPNDPLDFLPTQCLVPTLP